MKFIVLSGGPHVTLEEMEVGAIFEAIESGTLAVKTEYHLTNGQCECVLLASGEYAHYEKRNDEIVRKVLALEIQQ